MTLEHSKGDDMREQLKSHIAAVIEGIRHLSVDDAADLIAEVGDDMADDRTEDLFVGAILDGLRWGYHAAVTVEMGGGAVLRVLLPGGIGITHEWDSARDADPQIKAALAAVQATRTVRRGWAMTDFFDDLSSLCARELISGAKAADRDRVAGLIEGLATMLGRTIARTTAGDAREIEKMLAACENHVAAEAAGMAGVIRLSGVAKAAKAAPEAPQ